MCVLSNYHSTGSSQTQRWNGQEKKRITIPIATVIKSYNKSMGGVDQLDSNVAVYRTRLRQRKWCWPIFCYLVDCCVNNAWILSRDAGLGLTQLQFRRTLVLTLLKKLPDRIAMKAITRNPNVSNGYRFDGKDHWPIQQQTQRRCQGCHNGKSKVTCSKCDVGLHIGCFRSYHAL